MLQQLIEEANTEALTALLEENPDINQPLENGLLPIVFAWRCFETQARAFIFKFNANAENIKNPMPYFAVLQLLLDKGVNFALADTALGSPLLLIIAKQFSRLFKFDETMLATLGTLFIRFIDAYQNSQILGQALFYFIEETPYARNLEIIEKLLNSGADVNLSLDNEDGKLRQLSQDMELTPLLMACFCRQQAIIRLLIHHHADVNARGRLQGQSVNVMSFAYDNREALDNTLLFLQQGYVLKPAKRLRLLIQAEKTKHAELIHYLLAAKIDSTLPAISVVEQIQLLCAAEKDGCSNTIDILFAMGVATAVVPEGNQAENNYFAAGSTALHYATSHSLKLRLIEAGANVNLPLRGKTPVAQFIFDEIRNIKDAAQLQQHIMPMLKAFAAHHGNFNVTGHDDNSPLHLLLGYSRSTAETERMALLHWFLQHGVTINHQNKLGDTALHFLCQRSLQRPLLELFIEHQADFTLKNQDGKIPLELVSDMVYFNEYNSIFPSIEKVDTVEFATALRRLFAATPPQRINNEEQLLCAIIATDDIELANQLSAWQGTLSPESLGEALLRAVILDNLEMFNWLCTQQAPINYQASLGLSALHVAAGRRLEQWVAVLLAHGANPALMDKKGKRPMDGLFESIHIRFSDEPSQADGDEYVIYTMLFRIAKQLMGAGNPELYQGEAGKVLLLKVLTECHYTEQSEYGFHRNLHHSIWPFIDDLLHRGASIPADTAHCKALLLGALVENNLGLIQRLCMDMGELNITNQTQLAIKSLSIEIIETVKEQGQTKPQYKRNIQHRFEYIPQLINWGFDFASDAMKDYTFLVASMISSLTDADEKARALTVFAQVIDAGVNLSTCNAQGFSLFHMACEQGWITIVEKLIATPFNFSVNQAIYDPLLKITKSPLYLAIKISLELSKRLVALGADVQFKTPLGRTLLHEAAESGQLETITWLLEEQKVDVNAVGRYHYTSAHNALESILLNSSTVPNREAVCELLLVHGAQFNAEYFDKLMSTHALNETTLLSVIKKIIPMIDYEAIYKSRPLDTAIHRGFTHVLRYFLEHYRTLLLNHYGQSNAPLFFAIERNRPACFRLIVDAGVNQIERNFEGFSLAEVAFFHECSWEAFGLEPLADLHQDTFLHLINRLKAYPELNYPSSYVKANQRKYAYLLIRLFETPERAIAFIEKYQAVDSHQPIHDLCQFQLPHVTGWNQLHWATLALAHGVEITKYLHLAPRIEQTLGRLPLNLSDIQQAAKQIQYANEADDMALARLFKKHAIPEDAFDRVLKRRSTIVPPKKVPDIRIEGADIGHPDYYLARLPENDGRGYVLGAITNCCQSVGSAGEVCAWYGMESEYAGFYVVCRRVKENERIKFSSLLSLLKFAETPEEFLKKLPDKHQRKKYSDWFAEKHHTSPQDALLQLKDEFEDALQDTVVAQSLVWIGKNNGFVFDSWERRHQTHDVLCEPFLLRAVEMLTQQYPFTRVLIGTAGQTPEELCGEIVDDPEKPIDYYDYRDSESQKRITLDAPKKADKAEDLFDYAEDYGLFFYPHVELRKLYKNLNERYSYIKDSVVLRPLSENHRHSVGESDAPQSILLKNPKENTRYLQPFIYRDNTWTMTILHYTDAQFKIIAHLDPFGRHLPDTITSVYANYHPRSQLYRSNLYNHVVYDREPEVWLYQQLGELLSPHAISAALILN